MKTIENLISQDYANNYFDTTYDSFNTIVLDESWSELSNRRIIKEIAVNNVEPAHPELEYKKNPNITIYNNYNQLLNLFQRIQSNAFNFSLIKLDKEYASEIIHYCYGLGLEMFILDGEYKLVAQELVDGAYRDKIQEYGLLIKCPKSLKSAKFYAYIQKLMKKYDRYCCIIGRDKEVTKLFPDSCEKVCKQSQFTVTFAAKVFTTLQFEYYKENQFQWKGMIENEHLLRIYSEEKIAG